MLLNPSPEVDLPDSDYEEESDETGLSAILEEAGLSEVPPKVSGQTSAIIEALNANSAGVIDIAKTVSSVMSTGEKDADRLRASELASRLHGYIKDADKGNNISPVVNISINSPNNDAKNLLGILVPQEG